MSLWRLPRYPPPRPLHAQGCRLPYAQPKSNRIKDATDCIRVSENTSALGSEQHASSEPLAFGGGDIRHQKVVLSPVPDRCFVRHYTLVLALYSRSPQAEVENLNDVVGTSGFQAPSRVCRIAVVDCQGGSGLGPDPPVQLLAVYPTLRGAAAPHRLDQYRAQGDHHPARSGRLCRSPRA